MRTKPLNPTERNKSNIRNFKEAVDYFKSREDIYLQRAEQIKEDLLNGVNPFLDIDKILEDKIKTENEKS